ncbi:MAG: MFS transporter, partial [Thermoanaerobaculia bacterium]|nr:MFS transporter [Thermoanaerobaculia bacterium]
LASVTLVASAVGGIGAGVLADRFGRARVLVLSILAYSLFTGATATSRTVAELALWRALVGLGLGAEWSAGSVLVAETWPAAHRGKAIGLMQSGWAIGYVLAAFLAAAVIPTWGWRPLFVLGILPGLLAVWVRWRVPEPEIWRERGARPEKGAGLALLLRPPYLGRVVAATALATALLFAYWGLFTWVPSFLAAPTEAGGAGLGLVRSTGFVVAMQAGAFLGYTTFGFLADRFGRRPVFLAFVLGAAVVVPAFGLLARSEAAVLLLAPLVGYLGHGYFSVFGALLAELFPSSVRGAAQGFCYNAGRAVSALAPFTVGAFADSYGIGSALALTAGFYVAGAFLMRFLPETKGQELA